MSNAQSGVAGLVNSKLNSPEVKEAESKGKFMLYCDGVTKAQLETIAKLTHSGKIDIATAMFKLAVADGFASLVAAGLADPKTNGPIVKNEPAAPQGTAPTPPAPKA